MRVRRITEALKARLMRPRPDAIALWSLLVAFLASMAALAQTAILAGQLDTPYRTSLYVRQLDVAGQYYSAAHEQWAAIIDLKAQCSRPEFSDGNTEGFAALSGRFRAGATNLHNAYGAAVASLPVDFHNAALQIWQDNEFFVDRVVMASANCRELVSKYGDNAARLRADRMHGRAMALLRRMRVLLRVDTRSPKILRAELAAG